MPTPIISHLVGTTTLLAVALILVVMFSFVAFVYNMETMNTMLSEIAESCAREIVELVSIHTLGGGDYTVMLLNVPKDIGGQPYTLQVTDVAENKLLVNASLQIYRQVRIVVTPNFGSNPVHATPGEFQVAPWLKVASKIMLPLPQGYKPVLVAYRKSGYIYIGFAAVP
ncbi:hypothetical protein IG193_03130 [Infirmifilum lucidum]|uniref:Uncharacterized protein n=1 Tax=Infirmifilum lucidum TaxID=2776706 RepID=A0A7L9FI13_9CREN|nr:hypothetical protein [Infirmifilum lucidum]QOJ79468.1 hypothetical protein IG193_03130 [Infirmifilum lucidum]